VQSLTDPTFDARETFSRFPTGVVIIGADTGAGPSGMIVSSFGVGVSLEPPLVSFAAQRTSETWPTLRSAPTLGISILSNNQQDLCGRFASKSNRANRFDGVRYDVLPSGAVALSGATTVMEVELEDEFPAGDHTMVLLNVKSVRVDGDRHPLVFYRSGFNALAGT